MAHLRTLTTKLGVLSASPWAFSTLGAYTVLWLYFERSTLDWHAVATLITWAMTLLIQRAEHRDTQAIQAKLDELLRATENASGKLARVDEREPEDIEKLRDERNSQ